MARLAQLLSSGFHRVAVNIHSNCPRWLSAALRHYSQMSPKQFCIYSDVRIFWHEEALAIQNHLIVTPYLSAPICEPLQAGGPLSPCR
jgi:hypothetical protein